MVEPKNKNNFVLDATFVEYTILRLPRADDIVVDIANDSRVGVTFKTDYICLICKNVVWQSKKCTEC